MTHPTAAMPSVRRRPIPGMTAPPAPPADDPSNLETPPASPPPTPVTASPDAATPDPTHAAIDSATHTPYSSPDTSAAEVKTDPRTDAGRTTERRSADYAATRLVNFRLPVDLHDRYRRLIHDVELAHPRLRRPSLTELVIALLEEGPETVEHAAEAIRRKRAAEHEADA